MSLMPPITPNDFYANYSYDCVQQQIPTGPITPLQIFLSIIWPHMSQNVQKNVTTPKKTP